MKIQPYPHNFWTYISKEAAMICLIAGFTIIGFILIGFQIDWTMENINKYDWASWFFGIIPIIPIVAIWYTERKNKWMEDLPTYLNISLNDAEEREVARFEMVPIQNGIDIRQQATSVLRELINKSHINHLEQFLRNDRLEEQPYYDSQCIIENGSPFKLIKTTLLLTEPVKQVEDEKKADFEVQTKKEHSWYWCPLCPTNNKLKQFPSNQLPSIISSQKETT